MTGTFGGAYKVFSKGRKITTFQELLKSYKQWGKVKAPMTDKQVKSLAEEVGYNKRGKPKTQKSRIATNIPKKDKNGKITWRDALTGERMRGEFDKSKMPHWKESDIIKDRGNIKNINTGERLITRRENGTFLKKDKWVLVNRKGKKTILYPKENKKSKKRR